MRFPLPNILTIMRVGAIPFVVACFYWPSPWASCVEVSLFLLACLTDFFDGYLARQRAQVSEFGRTFDPIADKLLISAILLMLAGTHVLSRFALIPAAVILCREVLVSGLREFLSHRATALPVMRCAQWKTVAQMSSISLLLFSRACPEWKVIPILGEIGLWIAALFTIVTGAQYFREAFSLMRR
ncbi:MAG: CDP-diacylglycerol--glycerol-3-phosphate 3-phosphatidyltransferase [Holosporales bacterium]|jgi:cardiolipin synthase|nr:CDP-diacylglycerol--glycerol-3-phosphate 3-phosphatidyltransferase [Holosporales bacterium]